MSAADAGLGGLNTGRCFSAKPRRDNPGDRPLVDRGGRHLVAHGVICVKTNLALVKTICYTVAMKLDTYLKKHDETATSLASRLGVAISTITRIARGETKPNSVLAYQIELATQRKVRLVDLVGQ